MDATSVEQKEGSLLGGILTIIAYVVVAGFGAYYAYRVFKRLDYTVTSSKGWMQNPQANFTNKTFQVGLVDAYYSPLSLKTNNLTIYPFGFTRIPPKKTWSSYWSPPTSSCGSNCVMFNFGIMEGVEQNGPYNYTYLDINLARCNSGKCNWTETNTNLETAYLNVTFADFRINHDNYDIPGEIYNRTEYVRISSTIFSYVFIKFKQVNYTTNKGWFVDDLVHDTFWTMDSVTSFTSNLETNKIADLKMILFSEVDVFYRSYHLIPDALARAVGILSPLMTIIVVVLMVKGFFDKKKAGRRNKAN